MMLRLPAADLARSRAKATTIMLSRPPDEVIGDGGRPYMLRWKSPDRVLFGLVGIYIHRFHRDDDDRALHDHPWRSVSVLLSGRLREVYAPRGADPSDPSQHRSRLIEPGTVVFRRAAFAHRIEVLEAPAVTAFFVGARVREWGFHCPRGWRHWRDFCAPDDRGRTGRGCE